MKRLLGILAILSIHNAHGTTIEGASDKHSPEDLRIHPNSPEVYKKGFNNCNMLTNGEKLVATKLIKNGSIVFDVGANEGDWSKLIFAHTAPAMVYAFEPLPTVYKKLTSSLDNDSISTHNIAISNKRGTATFISYDNDKLSTFHSRPIVEQKFGLKGTPISVQTNQLDAFCSEHNIEYIDFLKIDTEGHEYFVLDGARRYLKKNRIHTIQFEYGGTYKDSNTTLEAVYNLLKTYDYTVYRIVSDGLISIPEWKDSLENYQYSNYLAIVNKEEVLNDHE